MTEALAIAGLSIGVLVLGVVVILFNRVVAPALEIDRYARHILDGGIGIAKNLDDAPAILRTRELAQTVPGLAVAYLKKLGLVQ